MLTAKSYRLNSEIMRIINSYNSISVKSAHYDYRHGPAIIASSHCHQTHADNVTKHTHAHSVTHTQTNSVTSIQRLREQVTRDKQNI